MRPMKLSDLNHRYSEKDFEVGKRVRIFINYSGSCTEIEIREGIILAPQINYLKMRVKKAGRVVDGKPDLKLGPYPYRGEGKF